MFLSGCGSVSAFENDLTQISVKFDQHLQPIWDMLIALCYVLGIVFIATAILKLKAYGQLSCYVLDHASMVHRLAYLMVGAGLLFVPTLLDMMTMTVWAYGFESVQGYPDEGNNFADIMVPIVKIIQVIGLVAFMRGWMIMLKLGSQGAPPGTLRKGLAYMIGGFWQLILWEL